MKSQFGLLAVFLALCLAAGAGIVYGQWVVDSVDIGTSGSDKLVYNSRAGVVYGLSYNGGRLFAIACSTNEVVAQVPLTYPADIEYDSLDNKLYCTVGGYGRDTVLVFDGMTHSRIGTIVTPGPWHLVWDRVDDRLYVTPFVDYIDVAVIDCRTDSVLCYISVPGEVTTLTINTRHRKLYCQNDAGMTVSVIDMNTNQVIRRVNVGAWGYCAAYSEAADRYYCDGAQGVAVIDGATDSVIRHIALPPGFVLTAILSVESESLVVLATSGYPSDSLFVIDVRRDSVRSLARIRNTKALAYSPTTDAVYCTCGGVWDMLLVVAADGSRVRSQIPVGDGPNSLALAPAYGYLYVGHGGLGRRVYVVRDELGIAGAEPVRVSATAGTAVVRGQLSYTGPVPAMLVDASGRTAQDLHVGNNDVSRLPPGVYIVVAPGEAEHRKIVLAAGD